MRRLTFKGFLKTYVRELSNSNSLYRLVREAEADNARLVAPLFLYAATNGKTDTLLKASRGTSFEQEYLDMSKLFDGRSAESLLGNSNVVVDTLPDEYVKVYRSFVSVSKKYQTENKTKDLIRGKVLRLMYENDVSMYRVVNDLDLNQGNLFAFLKQKNDSALSLDNARKVQVYLERAMPAAKTAR